MAFVDEITHLILIVALGIAAVSRLGTIRNLRNLENANLKYPSIRERTWWLIDIQMICTCTLACLMLGFSWWSGNPQDDTNWAYANNMTGDAMVWTTIVSLSMHAIIRELALRDWQIRSLAKIIGFSVLIPIVAKTTIYKPTHSYINPDGVIGYAAPSAVCFAVLIFSYRSDRARVGTMKFETLFYAIMAVISGIWFYLVMRSQETAWQGKLPLALYIAGSITISYGVPAYIANKASQKASASDDPRRALIDPDGEFPQGIPSVVPTELTVSVVMRTMIELGRQGKLQQSFTVGLYLCSMMLTRNPGYFSDNDCIYIPKIVVDGFRHQPDVLSTPPDVVGTNYMAQVHHYLSDIARLMTQRASLMGQGNDSPIVNAPSVTLDAGTPIDVEMGEKSSDVPDEST